MVARSWWPAPRLAALGAALPLVQAASAASASSPAAPAPGRPADPGPPEQPRTQAAPFEVRAPLPLGTPRPPGELLLGPAPHPQAPGGDPPGPQPSPPHVRAFAVRGPFWDLAWLCCLGSGFRSRAPFQICYLVLFWIFKHSHGQEIKMTLKVHVGSLAPVPAPPAPQSLRCTFSSISLCF